MLGASEPPPLNALIETVDGGLFVLDTDGRVAWADTTFLELVQVDDVDECGQFLTSVLGDDKEIAEFETTETRDEYLPVTVETESKSGIPLQISLRGLSDGRSIGWIRDSSERFQRKRELDQYRTVLDAVEDAVYMTDENRRFTWVNTAAERLFGYDRDTIIGQHLFEFLTDEQIEVAKQNVAYLCSENKPDILTFEMEANRKDGTTFPAETRATLLPGNGFAGTVGIIRDISDRKEREQELERKNDRLEAFANTVSHDLRNPLHIALGHFEFAREECESQHLEAIGTALERMDDLIDDLYTLALHGHQVEDVESIDIGSVAESAWTTIPTGEAELVVDGSPVVDANPSRLRQALENLFQNAVEHAGPSVTVYVGGLEPAGFYVEDDGRGIPSETRDQVFEAGYTTDTNGTGLGLDIVQEMATTHGWSLRLTEGADGGARFEFYTATDT